MRSPNQFTVAIIAFAATTFCFIASDLAAVASTRIRGEFEYDVDKRELSEWQIGPTFQLDDATELEIPIGQEDNLWLIRPELTYEIEASEMLTFEFSFGLESTFTNQPVEGFGGIEGRVDF